MISIENKELGIIYKFLNMTLEEVVLRFKEKPYLLDMGKGNLSKRFKCSQDTIVEARRMVKYNSSTVSSKPKVLIFDVETAPMQAYVWGRWKQNISLDATISEWFMICWSAKWLYSNEIISDVLTSEEAINEDDSRIVKHLWELIDEADVICAYNGRHADVKWMNSRFIIHNLKPPKPYFLIDPCYTAKQSFGFSSNKLDALAGYFGIPHKMETNFKLWKDCLAGDSVALNYMSTYCSQDIKILEEVYLKLRPWIKGHPNMGNLESTDEHTCSFCSSKNIEPIKNKYYYTSIGKYQLYRCADCGGVSRGRVNLNKNIKVINTAR